MLSARRRAALGAASFALVACAGAAAWWYGRPPGTGAASGSAATGATKCVAGGRVLYTDGVCPDGTRAMAVTGGSVTIVPGGPPAATGPTARLPHARDLLLDSGDGNLRDKRIERMVGQ